MTSPRISTLDTPRLLLRPLRNDDADALLAIFSDPEVMRYWNTPPWTTRQDALAFIAGTTAALAEGATLALGIVRKADQQLIGKCLLASYAPASRRAELGFGIARQAWGQGHVQEAAGALITHAFDALGLRRIEAEIDPANLASARALERLGFQREGLLRQRWEIDGVLSDSALYGLLRDDRDPRPSR